MATLIWALLLIVILTFEGITLYNKKKGDTLSEQVWGLMGSIWGRIILIPTWLWLTYHFFIEPHWLESLHLVNFVDDIVLVSVSLLIMLGYNLFKRNKGGDV